MLTLKNKKLETLKVLSAFVIFFLVNQISVNLPSISSEFRIFNSSSNWNWDGKIYTIICSILFLLFYKKYQLKDYFLTFKQENKFFKKGVIIIISLLIFKITLMFFAPNKLLNWETLFYQFSMPGLDEEIAYRGIMLGLLTKILKYKNLILNSSVWITAILFGFAHGLSLSKEFSIIFNIYPFLITMFYGLIWGWITIKSGSVLLALISHNLGNGMGNIIRMR
ncbi:CPBP family intramembrane glutamic endopeptidase [Polaribacter sargassicola]|uniref:CPBP family intramembrane glutamic endopeptidase n=1 Tax=Polaribacter sargassicola TaxID=2836891 RepID=UPI001F1F9F2B|nr:CPBP family intramembrane glutamic endopeptidase [Polaribacter sp. DS7-9]MCG1036253.1 CPBP family intramembrane metalloprotease [Polaribacter sp. DS7-9]